MNMKEFCEQMEDPTIAEGIGCWVGLGWMTLVAVGLGVLAAMWLAAEAWRVINTKILEREVEALKRELASEQRLVASKEEALNCNKEVKEGFLDGVANLARQAGFTVIPREEN